MAGMGEIKNLQAPMIQAFQKAGWTHIPGNQLDRELEQPMIESEVAAALKRLNPDTIDGDDSRVDEIIRQLRTLTLAVADDGLVETNRRFTNWLRGMESYKFVGGTHSHPIRLIDYTNPANNSYIVSDEARFGTAAHHARFDIVLWINGIPVAVGELKNPASKSVSWMNGATDLVDIYQPGWPSFFVPNTVVFATEGKEFMYAGVGTPVQHWSTWGPTSTSGKVADIIAAAVDMLNPATLQDLLADFTLFESPDSADASGLRKVVARYTQYEAVKLIVDRAKHPTRRKGLIYHTQGSGKTLAMVFAAGQLLRDPDLQNPTVVLVADRVQLVQQMWDQFRTVDMPRLNAPETAGELRTLLAAKHHGGQDQRGLIFTTVHKFKSAPLLNERSNIIVMVDEAHRTQEGDLGVTMRAALPNANLFAFSGTPIANLTHNTFATFGDDDDPNATLHAYDSDQSIADGMTVPIHVAPRKVEFALDKDGLDTAYADLVDAEGLDDDQAELVAKKTSNVRAFFTNPERVRQVCADIVDHFYSTFDPLGMKAQVVVYDRAACVAYHEELTRLLNERAEQEGVPADESAVVMTVTAAKGEDADWAKYSLSDAEEAALLNRFRTFGDPLKFLVCTAKLGTGFNAPIEGVMYLDKPLKDHTLFQTITRTNRIWRNPDTGKDKRYGTIVDYVGLGGGFARAMTPANADSGKQDLEVDDLVDKFELLLKDTMKRFAGIDVTHPGTQTLMDAQSRLPTVGDEEEFAAEYLMLEGIWEAAAPHPVLLDHKPAYRFLAQVYASIQPSTGKDALLWQRLGAKTLQLVHDHMSDIVVTHGAEVVAADADSIAKLLEAGLVDEPAGVEGKSVADIIDSIAARLKKAVGAGSGEHPVFKSLAERLDKLRQRAIATAAASIEWLQDAFELARDVKAAEKADEEGTLDLLPDPRVHALTQIFLEFAPEDSPKMVGKVVREIDEIVTEVTADNSGWAEKQKGDRLVRQSIRNVLKTHQMHTVDGLFERAYEYVREHY